MASIALICEGASEVKMLTYIVTRYLGDEIVVNAIQPALTQKGRQANEGGWLEVLNHCNDDIINTDENDAKKRCVTTNCIYKLNKRLQTEGIGIPETAKNTPEAIQAYNKVLKQLKRKDIPRIAQYNYGFQKFVEQMDGIKQ